MDHIHSVNVLAIQRAVDIFIRVSGADEFVGYSGDFGSGVGWEDEEEKETEENAEEEEEEPEPEETDDGGYIW